MKRVDIPVSNLNHDSAAQYSSVFQEVEEIYARPESTQLAPPATISIQERQREENARPQTSHYASVRARLESSDTDIGRQEAEEATGSNDGPDGILSSQAKFQELADVIYFWALAEAYLQHPQMQQDMRCTSRFFY